MKLHLLALCVITSFGTMTFCSAQEKTAKPVPTDKEKAEKSEWKTLLPKEGLEGWEVTNFGGEGEVKNKDGELTLEMGDPLTGITLKQKDFPKSNFEIELEAKRIEGGDFLCGLTYPVGDEHISFIAGGWGGGVVGISSIDGFDASENATTGFREFKNGQWYKFRVRVDDKSIKAWVDDKQVVDHEREGHKFSVRAEVMANRPVGFCAFQSKVAIRNLRWKPVSEEKPAK